MGQLGLFAEVERVELESRRAALISDPSIIAAALPRFRQLLSRFDELVRANDLTAAMQVADDADALAVELQGESLGILAPDGAGTLLEAAARAALDEIPMWGQGGSFVVTVGSLQARIDMDGVYSIGSPFSFEARAVQLNSRFISETGFRSFTGLGPSSIAAGSSPADFAAFILDQHIRRDLKGRLPFIEARYRKDGAA